MRTFAAMVCLGTMGCSFAMRSADVPANATPQQKSVVAGACSSSRSAPITDMVGTVAWTLFGTIFVVDSAPHRSCGGFLETGCHTTADDPDERLLGFGILGLALLQGIAAYSGFSKASDCETLQEEFEQPMPYGPAPYQPPAYGPPMPPQPAPGSERGVCRPDGSCDPGLTCASNHCVQL